MGEAYSKQAKGKLQGKTIRNELNIFKFLKRRKKHGTVTGWSRSIKFGSGGSVA